MSRLVISRQQSVCTNDYNSLRSVLHGSIVLRLMVNQVVINSLSWCNMSSFAMQKTVFYCSGYIKHFLICFFNIICMVEKIKIKKRHSMSVSSYACRGSNPGPSD